DCADDDWQRVLDVNVKGPFLCCKHGIPAIARTGGGSVVMLGSVLGSIGAPGYAAYCASKGALVNLAKQAAIEHAPDAVRVNVVAPSATDTGLFIQVASQAPDPDAIIKMVASRNPMGRLGTAAEGCDAVVLYPSIGLFVPYQPELDPAESADSCRRYDDWVAEYCGTDEGRLAAAGIAPLADPTLAAAETRRAAGLGLVAMMARPN